MNYFERSQVLKREIEADLGLCQRIKAFEKKEVTLDLFASGTSNSLFRLGQVSSGLFLAIRENFTYPRDDGEFAFESGQFGSLIYESYCIGAEGWVDSGQLAPLSVGGYIREIERPFLIVEDLTGGGIYKVPDIGSGNSQGTAFRNGKSQNIWIDIGLDYADLERQSSEMYNSIIDGTFDINSLKYFHPENRLNL